MNNDLSVSLYKKIEDMDNPREYLRWHCSSIYKCPLEQYLLRKGQPITNKPTSALRLRWQVGHKMEEAIRPYLEALYPDIKSNVRLTSDKLDMTGEYDNLVGTELYEVKSVHPFAFKHLEKERKPHLHYELQQHAYVLLLAEQGVEVTKINYIYLSLDGRVMCFTTDVQDELLDNVKARLRALNDAWKSQKPPECICLMKGHPLEKAAHQYCNYKDAYECCKVKSQTVQLTDKDFEPDMDDLLNGDIPEPINKFKA